VKTSRGELLTFAENSLRAIAARHPVPFRVAVIEHSKDLVLAVGVERAPDLIPCEESGGAPVYYVRSFDGTVGLADVVAADLLLGRRARPAIALQAVINQRNVDATNVNFDVHLKIQNDGLVWIDGVRAGLVLPSAYRGASHAPIDSQLAREVDATSPASVVHVQAAEVSYKWPELAPLQQVDAMASGSLPAQLGTFAIAAYVVAKGHPPYWWEIRGTMRDDFTGRTIVDVAVERCRGVRPRIWSLPPHIFPI